MVGDGSPLAGRSAIAGAGLEVVPRGRGTDSEGRRTAGRRGAGRRTAGARGRSRSGSIGRGAGRGGSSDRGRATTRTRRIPSSDLATDTISEPIVDKRRDTLAGYKDAGDKKHAGQCH